MEGGLDCIVIVQVEEVGNPCIERGLPSKNPGV